MNSPVQLLYILCKQKLKPLLGVDASLVIYCNLSKISFARLFIALYFRVAARFLTRFFVGDM
jgi:hypothetical protein